MLHRNIQSIKALLEDGIPSRLTVLIVDNTHITFRYFSKKKSSPYFAQNTQDMIILNWLKQPYPLRNSPTPKLLLSLLSGLFVALFLVVFQPFGTREHEFAYKYPFLWGYGGIVALTFLFFEFTVKAFLDEDKWVIGKQILWLATEVVFIVIICYLYFINFFKYDFTLNNFLYFLGICLSIGIFPIVLITLTDYIYQLQQNQQQAARTNKNLQTTNHTDHSASPPITIQDENGTNSLGVPPTAILLLKAAGNYTEFFLIKEDSTIEKNLLRGNLKYFESQLQLSHLVRCHRSFIANLNKVKQTSGNAQGYKLHLHDEIEPVPISRNKSKFILQKLNATAE